MAIGAKRNETRPRRWNLSGDLAICSTQKFDEAYRRLAYNDEPMRTVLAKAGLIPTQRFGMVPENLPTGCVLAVVEVFAVERSENFLLCDKALLPLRVITPQEKSFGDYRPGRWVYITGKLRHLKNPVPVRGYQGIFNLPPDVAIRVSEQL